MGPYIIGITQRYSKCMSYYSLNTKIFDDVRYHLYQTILVWKFLKDTYMENCNGLKTPIKDEENDNTDKNVPEDEYSDTPV